MKKREGSGDGESTINGLNFYKLLVFCVALTAGLPATGQSPAKAVVNPVVNDFLQQPKSVEIGGYLGQQLDDAYHHRILAQDAGALVAPFKTRDETRLWQTEFWGKWFTSAVLAYRCHPSPALKAVLDHTVADLIATQSPDGYIGNYKAANRLQGWDIWGMKYCMMGLLDYYALTRDKNVLGAAEKLAGYLMGELHAKHKLIVQTGNYRGMASSSVLGVICSLYTYTGNRKYLDFAERIVKEWETDEGPRLISKASVNVAERFPKPQNWYSPEQGQKAYEMMSCYEGLLDLYRLTGRAQYKSAAVKTWENINRTEINIAGSGASAECWFGGKALQASRVYHYQETCVSVTWIRLTLQLLRLTGDAKYADAIERTYYNALLGSMYPGGANWAKYTPLAGQRLPGSGQCGMALNCCEANGPRGLFALPYAMVMADDKGLSVNFFSEGRFKLSSPGGQAVSITQQTDYPVSGKVDLSIRVPKPEEMTIRIRIPGWSKKSKLFINGEAVSGILSGKYKTLTRTWTTGDRIDLELDMRGRVVWMGAKSRWAAIMRGPIVLASDSRFQGNRIIDAVRPIADTAGYIRLSPVKKKAEGVLMQYEAPFLPESYTETGADPTRLTLIDYSSAGYGPAHSSYRVWLPQLYDPRK